MESRDRSMRLGRDLLAKELRERNHSLTAAEKEGLLEPGAQRVRAGSAEDMLVLVGYGKLTPAQAAEAIYPSSANRGDSAGEDSPPLPASENTGLHRRPVKKSVAGVRVQGEADIVVKFAKCLHPGPGRFHRRLHQPGAGGHRPHPRLREGAGPGPRPQGGGVLG
jgi:GTP pyrophosphokinase